MSGSDLQERQGATIFARILALFLCVNLITSGALLYTSYRFSRQSIVNRTEQQISRQMASIRDNFETEYLTDLRRSLEWLTSSSELDAYMFASTATQQIAKRKIEKQFLSTIRDFDAYHGVSFVDLDGKPMINTVGNRRVPLDANLLSSERLDTPTLVAGAKLFRHIESIPLLLSSGNMEWFMPQREIHVEGPYLDEDGEASALAGYAKLDLDTGMFGGAVILRVRLAPFLNYLRDVLFFEDNPIWVLDPQGRVLQQPGDLETTFDPRPYLDGEPASATGLRRVAEGIVNYQDFTITPGKPFLRIAVSIPSSTLLRDLEPAIKFFSIVLAGSAIIVLIVALYVSTYLARPIRELARAAQRLARGELSTRVTVATSGEVQTLVRSFNSMAEDLNRSMVARDATLLSLETEVAERRKAERELKQQALELSAARTEAERAAGAKSEFLATMSHEIRTPINGMLGMTELLLRSELDETQLRFARTAHSSGEALLHVINDILDFSKIEAGKLELSDTAFDVRELVEDLGQVFADQAQRKGVELLCAVSPETETRVIGDGGRLRQVLTNLIGNAVKFTSRGEIVLRVAKAFDTAEHIALDFEVRDTGIGIPEQAQAQVFESFSQADSSTTRKHGGTGLGLAISRRLVSLMGGNIYLLSKPGRGSTFSFDLTFRRQPGVAPPLPATRLRGQQVLVVGASDCGRQILLEMLQAWGCQAQTCDDAAQAAKLLARSDARPFDAVVLDTAPGTDRGALLAHLRDVTALSPIVLGDLQAAATANGNEVLRLSKPVRSAELYRALLQRLGAGPAAAIEAPAGEPELPRLRGHVLVVEDHSVNQELARTMLEMMGCTADVTLNGIEALSALERCSYDAILMDCQMPEMDGYAATQEIRRRESSGALSGHNAVIALTANALPGDEERCLRAGMDAYLCKPFTLHTLAASLRSFLASTPPAQTGTEPEAPGDAAGVLDHAVLDSLRALQAHGRRDVLSRILGLYLERAPLQLEELRAAVQAGDAAQVEQAAHGLKGTSANVGAARLAHACEELERCAGETDLRSSMPLFAQIEQEFQAAQSALARAHQAAA